MSCTPSLRPPISEPLQPQHPASKSGIYTTADLAVHQDPTKHLWIAIRDKDSEVYNFYDMSKFSHPGSQEIIENARGRNVTRLYSQCCDRRIDDHPDVKKLGTINPESITEEWLRGSSSPETVIARQATKIRAPIASMTNKALVEDLLGDYVPLNEKANREPKDGMQEEDIEEAQEEDDDDEEGYRREKRDVKVGVKVNKGVKRAKQKKPASWSETDGELDTHWGNVAVEAVRRSKRLRDGREVIVVEEDKEEEVLVSRKKAKKEELSEKETALSAFKSGRGNPKKVVTEPNLEPQPKLKLTATKIHFPEGSQSPLPRLSKQNAAPARTHQKPKTQQSLSSAVLRNRRLKINVGAEIAHFPVEVQRRLLKTIERPRADHLRDLEFGLGNAASGMVGCGGIFGAIPTGGEGSE